MNTANKYSIKDACGSTLTIDRDCYREKTLCREKVLQNLVQNGASPPVITTLDPPTAE